MQERLDHAFHGSCLGHILPVLSRAEGEVEGRCEQHSFDAEKHCRQAHRDVLIGDFGVAFHLRFEDAEDEL